MAALDTQLAKYIIFTRALTDAFDNGISETKLGSETRPCRFVQAFPEQKSCSDFTFAFFARGVADYDAACDIVGYGGSVEERNNILIECSNYLNPPDARKRSGNQDVAWGMDFERQVAPVLKLMGRSTR